MDSTTFRVSTDDRFPGWVSAAFGALVLSAILAGGRCFDSGAAADIKGPDKVAAGAPAVFDASFSRGDSFEWDAPPGTASTTLDDGRRLVVVAQEGRHAVTLTVRSAAWGRLTTARQKLEFLAEGDSPAPAPEPNPGPQPGPAPSDPVAKWVAENVRPVASQNRAAEARDIAGILRGISAAIAAGTISTAHEAGSQADKLIDERLGASSPAWEDFRWRLLDKAKSTLGVAPSVSAVGAFLQSVATGLEAT